MLHQDKVYTSGKLFRTYSEKKNLRVYTLFYVFRTPNADKDPFLVTSFHFLD